MLKLLFIWNNPHQKRLKSFIEAAGFDRKYVSLFSDLVKPLNTFLKDYEKFEWSEIHTRAFEQLNKELVSARYLPTLSLLLQLLSLPKPQL